MRLKFYITISSIFFLLFIESVYCQKDSLIFNNNENHESIDPLDLNSLKFFENDVPFLIINGDFAFNNGEYYKAAQHYLQILNSNYDEVETLYKLAQCYAMLNQPQYASACLIKAIQGGYRYVNSIYNDPAFANLKGNKIFDETIKEIKSWEESLGNTIYLKASKLVKCLIKLPENYDSQKKYTLIVGLHGYGASSEEFIGLGDYFKNENIIFAAPQGAYSATQSITSSMKRFSWELRVNDKELWKRGDPLTIEYIIDAVKQISSTYNIKKVFLLGFSQGAAYTYLTGIKHYADFDGIICIGGKLPETNTSYAILSEENIKNANKLNVLIAHSKTDKAISYDYSLSARKKLKNYEYNVKHMPYLGGHSVPQELITKIEKWINKLTSN